MQWVESLFAVRDVHLEIPVYTHLQGHGYEGYDTSHVTKPEHVTA